MSAPAVSGIGAGAIYATCVGNAVKWFPDRRGLAVGMTAAGFGAGAALTVIPIKMMIEALRLRLGVPLVRRRPGRRRLLILACCCARPSRARCRPPAPVRGAAVRAQLHQREVLRVPVFWLLYVMFVLVSASGLMATAQLAPIAKDFGIAEHRRSSSAPRR